MFNGYKTYLAAAAIGLAASLHYLGYLNDSIYQTLVGVLAGGGLAALRSAVSRANKAGG